MKKIRPYLWRGGALVLAAALVVLLVLSGMGLSTQEPEPLPQVRWPLSQLMTLLDEEDFNEARNVSALFLLREWLQAQGRL